MPIEVTLPRIDVDSTTGKIARWLAKDGAAVAKGEPLFEMESEKAAVEVESPAAGTVRDIILTEGESAPIGSVVARIFLNSEPYAAATRDNREPAAPVAIRPAPAALATSPAAAVPIAETSSQGAVAGPAGTPSRPRATPLARRLARQHGIALEQLKGSGPNGRIQQRDIVQAQGADKRPARFGTGTLNVTWLKPGNGPPLVLIHGFGSELGSWRPLIADESLSGPILAIDLPGHGLSPLGAETSFAHLVESAEAALVRLGIEHADLAGHSLGGAVAAALAESTHLGARSLTMISSAGLGPDINGAFIDGMNRATTEEGLTAWLKLGVANAERLNPAFVKAILTRRREMDTQSAQQRLAAALFADSTQTFSIRSTLDRLSIPVKVIFGLEDQIIPPRHARGLPGTVAVHLFRAVGHLPHIEARGGVLQLLREIVCRDASPQP